MLRGRALQPLAQTIVDQRTGRKNDHRDAAREQLFDMLAHGRMRCGLDHHFRSRRDQLVALGDERDPEFLRESLPARSFAAAHHRNHFGLAHRAAPSLLEEEPRDDAAADKSNAHGD